MFADLVQWHIVSFHVIPVGILHYIVLTDVS